MSIVLYAFLDKNKVPSRDAWQESIDKCGFDFQLNPNLKSFEDSGFLPCKLMGDEGGFEIDYFPSSELDDELKTIANGRDFCISFRFSSSMAECASAMIASYALAKFFDAVVSSDGEAPQENLEALLKETKASIELAKKKTFPNTEIKRTKANFIKQFFELLKNVNPNFVQNKNEKGNFFEFILKDNNNFNISYNIFHKSEDYYLCFAILLTDDYDEIWLDNPFILGSRFDNNKTIYRQILDDLNIAKSPNKVWSHGQWRSNTFDNISKAISTPMDVLYPHYINTLYNGRENLISLYTVAMKVINNFTDIKEADRESLLKACKELGLPTEEVAKLSLRFHGLNAFRISKGGKYVSGFGGKEFIDLANIPIEYLVINNIESLYKNKHKLSSVINKLENMKL